MIRTILVALALSLSILSAHAEPQWCTDFGVLTFNQDGTMMTTSSPDATEKQFIPLDEPFDFQTIWKNHEPIYAYHYVWEPCGFAPTSSAIDSELGEDTP